MADEDNKLRVYVCKNFNCLNERLYAKLQEGIEAAGDDLPVILEWSGCQGTCSLRNSAHVEFPDGSRKLYARRRSGFYITEEIGDDPFQTLIRDNLEQLVQLGRKV